MRIAVTRPLPPKGLDLLDGYEVVQHRFPAGEPDEEQLIDIAQGAAALITLLSDPVTDRVLQACPDLRIIAQYAVGYDNIDLEAARARGVAVTNTPGALTEATADMAFALLLAAARHIAPADRYVRAGAFSRWEADLMLGAELNGGVIGIVGLGRIGAAMARRALGFGMRVCYHNRSRANPSVEQKLGARYVSLDALLETSDVVSLHCNLNASSRGLIGREAFARMKRSSILVNTARGAVVDEEALAEALRNRTIRAAGLDVFEREPAVHPGLLDLDNVTLAPHLGSATGATRLRMAEMCAESVRAALGGARHIPHRVA